jgi:hypothetical protein
VKFPREDLKLGLEGDGPLAETVCSGIVDTSRWSIHYERVFKYDGKFYRTHYSVGATEQQDERPYEYEDDEIECEEVFPVEKTVTVYLSAEERAKAGS